MNRNPLGKINVTRDLFNQLVMLTRTYETYKQTVPEGENNPTLDSLQYFVEYLESDLLDILEKSHND